MPIKNLEDGTSWKKATYWDGTDLKGYWNFTIKIDGLRCIRGADGKPYSRDSKPIKHLEHMAFNDAEFYCQDWNTSVSILHSETPKIMPQQSMLYNLDPIDPRLDLGSMYNPTTEEINKVMTKVLAKGYEGLVLRNGSKWLKVVPTKMADIRILDILEGNGKYKGVAGSIVTAMGNVGSFARNDMGDIQCRKYLLDYKVEFIGKIIQVGYRDITEDGKFKFPRMIRIREDKNTEDLPHI